jgi:deazaflavin-dependent oxidoreductase (nitroreductase family)
MSLAEMLSDPLRHVVNPTMSALLRSPLHRLFSGNILLLTFTGRKTGKSYTTPLSYAREGDRLYCFTDAAWSRNLRGGAPVSVTLGRKAFQGVGEAIVGDPNRIGQALTHYFQQVPRDAKFYSVTMDRNGRPDAQQVARASRGIIFVEIQLPAVSPSDSPKRS